MTDKKSIRFAILVSALYLSISYLLIGFKFDQLALVILFNVLYFASRPTRSFILGFSIFIVYWIIFDYMKAFPNYRFNDVRIESLYNLEKNMFGFNWGGGIVTPNEYFAANADPLLDILSGIFYLCWIPVPLIFAGVVFFKNRNYFFQFALTFFLVNIIGFIGYYLYPAAPPWYVVENGFQFIANTPGNPAGLVRFDELTGTGIFAGLYTKSSNVFAAMPSLHAAYMMIVCYYAWRLRWGFWILVFAIITLGIWFAAVYSSHHYILDIIAGIACAVIGISLFQLWVRSNAGKKAMAGMMKVTSVTNRL